MSIWTAQLLHTVIVDQQVIILAPNDPGGIAFTAALESILATVALACLEESADFTFAGTAKMFGIEGFSVKKAAIPWILAVQLAA